MTEDALPMDEVHAKQGRCLRCEASFCPSFRIASYA